MAIALLVALVPVGVLLVMVGRIRAAVAVVLQESVVLLVVLECPNHNLNTSGTFLA